MDSQVQVCKTTTCVQTCRYTESQVSRGCKFHAFTDDLQSTCVDLCWVAKRRKTCVDLLLNLSSTKSHHKSMQVHGSSWGNETQVAFAFELDQSRCKSMQVHRSRCQTKRKLDAACVDLRVRLARQVIGLGK